MNFLYINQYELDGNTHAFVLTPFQWVHGSDNKLICYCILSNILIKCVQTFTQHFKLLADLSK